MPTPRQQHINFPLALPHAAPALHFARITQIAQALLPVPGLQEASDWKQAGVPVLLVSCYFSRNGYPAGGDLGFHALVLKGVMFRQASFHPQ